MSLSTCNHCGGHIPLGPDASNRCEKCGRGVFDVPYKLTSEDKEWMGFPADGRAELQPEINRLRVRVAELEGIISKTIDAINSQSPKPRMSIHARAMINKLRDILTP